MTRKKNLLGFVVAFLLLAAVTPWLEDDLLSAHARSEISDQVQAENLQGNKVVDGELICDGLCVDRYPFLTLAGVQDATWVIPFWGSVYRVK